MSAILVLYVCKALKMVIIKHAQVNMGFNEWAVPLMSPTHALKYIYIYIYIYIVCVHSSIVMNVLLLRL